MATIRGTVNKQVNQVVEGTQTPPWYKLVQFTLVGGLLIALVWFALAPSKNVAPPLTNAGGTQASSTPTTSSSASKVPPIAATSEQSQITDINQVKVTLPKALLDAAHLAALATFDPNAALMLPTEDGTAAPTPQGFSGAQLVSLAYQDQAQSNGQTIYHFVAIIDKDGNGTQYQPAPQGITIVTVTGGWAARIGA